MTDNNGKNRDLPMVSIAMPCYNRGENLKKFLENIDQQTYPKEKLEVVIADFYSTDDTKRIAKDFGCKVIQDRNPDMEVRRTIALEACSGELIFIADDDNYFVNTDLIAQMVKIMTEDKANAVQCTWQYYDKKDYLINRYCALIGTMDPTTFYLKREDHMPVIWKKWKLPGTVVQETERYFKVRFKLTEVLTMGDQGFMCRKDDILRAKVNDKILHMDICSNLVKEGRAEFIFLKDYFGHNCVKNSAQMMKKLKRNIDRFNVDGNERMMNYEMSFGKMITLGLTMGTFIIPFKDAIAGFIKVRDVAWFVHPFICFRVTLMYTWSTLKSKMKR